MRQGNSRLLIGRPAASATMGPDVAVVSLAVDGYDEPHPAATPAPVPGPAPQNLKAVAEPAGGGGGRGGGGTFRILRLVFRSAEVICCVIAIR